MNPITDKLVNTSAAQQALDAWPLPAGEPIIGKTYLADGYVYRDLPRMEHRFLKELIDIIGSAEIVWLSRANYGDTGRGQILISPTGQANLSAHLKRTSQA